MSFKRAGKEMAENGADISDLTISAYVSAVRLALIKRKIIDYFNGFAADTKKPDFFKDTFVKWVFLTNMRGDFKNLTITRFHIDDEDIQYFNKNYAVSKKAAWNPDEIDNIVAECNETIIPVSNVSCFDKIIENKPIGQFDRRKRMIGCNGDQQIAYDVPESVYVNLIRRYKGSNFVLDAFRLLTAYELVSLPTEHLAVPPEITRKYFNVEMFGTPWNTTIDFCSPFDTDAPFGSQGSFFNYEPPEGYYCAANPPYDNPLMEATSRRLTELLGRIKFTVVVVLPVWDGETRRKLGEPVFEEKFPAYEILRDSKYFIDSKALPKNNHAYWDYRGQQYIRAAPTHVVMLSSMDKYDADLVQKICDDWVRITEGSMPMSRTSHSRGRPR